MTNREIGIEILDALERRGLTGYQIELALSAAIQEFRKRHKASGKPVRSLTADEIRRRQEISRRGATT